MLAGGGGGVGVRSEVGADFCSRLLRASSFFFAMISASEAGGGGGEGVANFGVVVLNAGDALASRKRRAFSFFSAK